MPEKLGLSKDKGSYSQLEAQKWVILVETG
jgi:hypothetical protein